MEMVCKILQNLTVDLSFPVGDCSWRLGLFCGKKNTEDNKSLIYRWHDNVKWQSVSATPDPLDDPAEVEPLKWSMFTRRGKKGDPLVNMQKTMENHHDHQFLWENQL